MKESGGRLTGPTRRHFRSAAVYVAQGVGHAQQALPVVLAEVVVAEP